MPKITGCEQCGRSNVRRQRCPRCSRLLCGACYDPRQVALDGDQGCTRCAARVRSQLLKPHQPAEVAT
jgi:hypothetical protein